METKNEAQAAAKRFLWKQVMVGSSLELVQEAIDLDGAWVGWRIKPEKNVLF